MWPRRGSSWAGQAASAWTSRGDGSVRRGQRPDGVAAWPWPSGHPPTPGYCRGGRQAARLHRAGKPDGQEAWARQPSRRAAAGRSEPGAWSNRQGQRPDGVATWPCPGGHPPTAGWRWRGRQAARLHRAGKPDGQEARAGRPTQAGAAGRQTATTTSTAHPNQPKHPHPTEQPRQNPKPHAQKASHQQPNQHDAAGRQTATTTSTAHPDQPKHPHPTEQPRQNPKPHAQKASDQQPNQHGAADQGTARTAAAYPNQRQRPTSAVWASGP